MEHRKESSHTLTLHKAATAHAKVDTAGRPYCIANPLSQPDRGMRSADKHSAALPPDAGVA